MSQRLAGMGCHWSRAGFHRDEVDGIGVFGASLGQDRLAFGLAPGSDVVTLLLDEMVLGCGLGWGRTRAGCIGTEVSQTPPDGVQWH